MTTNMFHDVKRVMRMYFLEKINTALQNLENHKVLLKGSEGPNEGSWLALASLEFLGRIFLVRNSTNIWLCVCVLFVWFVQKNLGHF